MIGTLAHTCLVLALCLSFDGPARAAEAADPAPATAVQQTPAFKGQQERMSYALGLNAGSQYLKTSLEVDPDLFGRGLRDALSGNPPLLTEEQVRTVIADTQSELKRKQLARQRELPLKNRQEGEAFLAGNRGKAGIVTLESGLQYRILEAGDGQKPTIDDTVVGHYRGSLIDGTEFASSWERDRPASFAVKGVIEGWAEALQLMPVGSRWRLFVPSDLAYGERGAGRAIGPNATLILEVELLAIKDTAASGTRVPVRSDAAVPASDLRDIKMSFKLDPRLTRGRYMGDRWVSPPTYTGVRQEGKEYAVEARAEGLDAKGRPMRISPEWIPSDPGMVTVSPAG
jgi:FKBP-type peptidyl-prolyl cis-trans isomerase FklB